MKITNLSGKKILLVPGDNDPASGMPINANVIALVTKDVPVVEPNAPVMQFAVVDAETRKQFLLINGSQLVTLRPVPNKNVMPINLVIGKPSKLLLSRFTCIFSDSNIQPRVPFWGSSISSALHRVQPDCGGQRDGVRYCGVSLSRGPKKFLSVDGFSFYGCKNSRNSYYSQVGRLASSYYTNSNKIQEYRLKES